LFELPPGGDRPTRGASLDFARPLIRFDRAAVGYQRGCFEHFIITTRRSVDHPTSMPNPYLLEYQVQEVVTYILSLRK
jgi:hypothetical protein